jgi:uncharacterized membrane protein
MYRIIWLLSVLIIVSAILLGYMIAPSLPANMPSHWNSAGQVDGWQSTSAYVWTIPAIALVFVVVLGIISMRLTDPRIRPHIALSAGLFTAYMIGLHGVIGIRSFAGQEMNIAEFMRLMAGLFMGLAFVIKDIPPNHVAGFRLPWTMNDPDTWRRTHTIGFWGMLIGGGGCLIVTLIPIAAQYIFGLGIGSILGGVIIPSAYSYWYARNKRRKSHESD